MATITTNDSGVLRGKVFWTKRSLTGAKVYDDGIRISARDLSSFRVTLSDTIDGQTFGSWDDLMDYVITNFFEGGSGPGTEPSWDDITDKPAVIASGDNQADARTSLGLGTAATTDSDDYATAAQGGKADTALQPGDAVDEFEAGKIAKYSNIGALNTATPQFPENAVNLSFLNSRLSANQRLAIDALVSPEADYADMEEATVAIKSIIDALKAT